MNDANTLLHMRASQGDPLGVRHALSLGADPNSQMANGFTPLMMALRGNVSSVGDKPASAPSDSSWTRQYEECSLILLGITNRRLKSNDGFSAFHHAARLGRDRIVAEMLPTADPFEKNNRGMDALELCRRADRDSTLALIEGWIARHQERAEINASIASVPTVSNTPRMGVRL